MSFERECLEKGIHELYHALRKNQLIVTCVDGRWSIATSFHEASIAFPPEHKHLWAAVEEHEFQKELKALLERYGKTDDTIITPSQPEEKI